MTTINQTAHKGHGALISHDRHLIDATMERLWLVHNGSVGPYDGSMEDYRKLVLSIGKQASGNKKAETANPDSKQQMRKEAAKKRIDLAPLKAKISEKEKQIQKLEQAIGKIDSSLSIPGIYETHPEKATEFAKKRAEAERMLAAVEEEWLTLGAELEAAAQP